MPFSMLTLCFANETMHKQIQNLFPKIVITLEQIHIFKTSLRAEQTAIQISAAASPDRPLLAAQSNVVSLSPP
jgi:hypothetical protein